MKKMLSLSAPVFLFNSFSTAQATVFLDGAVADISAKVSVPFADDELIYRGIVAAEIQTDSLGKYEFNGINPGTYESPVTVTIHGIL